MVSIAAAHVLALQLLLAGVVATQMAVAAAVDGAICSGFDHGAAPDSGKTGSGLHHAPCAVCAFAATASPLPVAAVPGTPAGSLHTVAAGDVAVAAPASRRHDPRSSQGPPPSA